MNIGRKEICYLLGVADATPTAVSFDFWLCHEWFPWAIIVNEVLPLH